MKVVYINLISTLIRSSGKEPHTTPNILKVFRDEMETMISQQKEIQGYDVMTRRVVLSIYGKT